MLKPLTKDEPASKSSDSGKKDATLQALQTQLNELKLKVLKVSSRRRAGLDRHPVRPV